MPFHSMSPIQGYYIVSGLLLSLDSISWVTFSILQVINIIIITIIRKFLCSIIDWFHKLSVLNGPCRIVLQTLVVFILCVTKWKFQDTGDVLGNVTFWSGSLTLKKVCIINNKIVLLSFPLISTHSKWISMQPLEVNVNSTPRYTQRDQ